MGRAPGGGDRREGVVSTHALPTLTAEEQRLLVALREIPQSPLRDRFAELVAELVEFVSHPTCAEMQADGAPCDTANATCDECRKVTELLEGLRRRLHAG
jgi:hypothetical protein